MILWHLSRGAMRTSELRRSIPEITQRMLIRHLQELVCDGILVRVADGTVRSTHYRISEYGETLLPLLENICAWGRIHLQRQLTPRVEAAVIDVRSERINSIHNVPTSSKDITS
jgi:DNA-binding HxlR family transcriptional regulator